MGQSTEYPVEYLVRAVIQKSIQQAQPLIEGAAAVVEGCFYPVLLDEAERTSVTSSVFALKQSLLSSLLATLQSAGTYGRREDLLCAVSKVLPQLTMALVASLLKKDDISLLLMDLEALHKRLIVDVVDRTLTAIIDDAVAVEVHAKQERASRYLGHWIDGSQSGKVRRGVVSAFQPSTESLVISSMSGETLAELSLHDVEIAIQSGEMALLERADQFDRTLEALIDDIRKT